MNHKHALAALTFVAWMAPAMAARPLITDDARIVDPKSCQLETWLQFHPSDTEYWAVPACNPTGNWELGLGGSVDRMNGGRLDFSNVQMQGKTLLKPLQTNGYGVAFTLGTVHQPTAEEKRLFTQLYVNVPISFSFADDRFLLHLNLGANHDREMRETRMTWGVGSETQLTPRVYLVAETFGQDRGTPSYQAGFRFWVVPSRVQIDTTYGNTFSGRTSQRFASIGLRLLSPPFLP